MTHVWSKEVPHLLDFHGTEVTPGHAYQCGDGPHKGQFRPLIEILMDDGALIREDGSLVRAATGCPVGSELDRKIKMLWTITPRPKEGESIDLDAVSWNETYVRLGTRYARHDGTSPSVADFLEAQGHTLTDEGLIDRHDGEAPTPLHEFGRQPRPEGYVLARSGLTLEEIMGTPESLNDEIGYALPATVIAAGHAASPGGHGVGTGFTPPEGLAARAGRRASSLSAAAVQAPGPSLNRQQRRKAEREARRQRKKQRGI